MTSDPKRMSSDRQVICFFPRGSSGIRLHSSSALALIYVEIPWFNAWRQPNTMEIYTNLPIATPLLGSLEHRERISRAGRSCCEISLRNKGSVRFRSGLRRDWSRNSARISLFQPTALIPQPAAFGEGRGAGRALFFCWLVNMASHLGSILTQDSKPN